MKFFKNCRKGIINCMNRIINYSKISIKKSSNLFNIKRIKKILKLILKLKLKFLIKKLINNKK